MQGKKTENLDKWSSLLRAVRLNEAKFQGVRPFLEALERAYSESLFNQRAVEAARESWRKATQRQNHTLDTGCDAAISLRHFIKSILGPWSEELLQYGMKPRSRRRRRAKRPAETLEQPS